MIHGGCRVPHKCVECECIGTDPECWFCGSTDLEYHPYKYSGGHHFEPKKFEVYIPGGGGHFRLNVAECDEPLPWKVSA